MAMAFRQRPRAHIEDVRHIKVCGSKDTYCGHPRQGGIFNFGDAEIAVIHSHASCAYQDPLDVSHSFINGYASRAKILLQRSLDNGETWPQENNVVIFDASASLAARRQWLLAEARERSEMDMSRPESVFYFGRTPLDEPVSETSQPSMVCFVLRSIDKGRNWEDRPLAVEPPPGMHHVHKDNHPVVRMPDGSFLAAMSTAPPGQVSLYGSDDNGMTWNFLSTVARDATGLGRPTYAALLLVPRGRLLCFALNIFGQGHFIGMAHSDDGGYSWSELRPIVVWGHSPWLARRKPGAYGYYAYYRSPWPMWLQDGRLLLLFARRKPPCGIGGLVSEDEGQSWSEEFILRDDGSSDDLGYPVATQLDDGRIFTAYYFTLEDGNKFGGSRFIAGTFFRLR